MRQEDRCAAKRLYRDPLNGKLMGVCAGLADYFGWNATFVRILAVIALIWFSGLTLIAYFLLGFMLPDKPDRRYDWDSGDNHWRSIRSSSGEAGRDLRHRFRELERKVKHIEAYVASRLYDIDRQFRNLKD